MKSFFAFFILVIITTAGFAGETAVRFALTWPLATDGAIFRHYGPFVWTNTNNKMVYSGTNTGLTIETYPGTYVLAAADGVVEKAEWYGGYGFRTVIRHEDGITTTYSHLMLFATNITNGVKVKQGEVIGYVGATGKTTDYHLHFEVITGTNTFLDPENAAFDFNCVKHKGIYRFNEKAKR